MSDVVVRTMVFDMGEWRAKHAPMWLDPFAAYKIGKKGPTPIRPQEGKALWREFAGLFLQERSAADGNKHAIRPSILGQIARLELSGMDAPIALRCVGLRTDMKGKVFEWVDAGFDVPPAVLADWQAGDVIRDGLGCATECENVIVSVFRTYMSGSSRKSDRFGAQRQRMKDVYWATLAAPFRTLVMGAGVQENREPARRAWLDQVTRAATDALVQAVEAAGDSGRSLREQVQAEAHARRWLGAKKKEYMPDE